MLLHIMYVDDAADQRDQNWMEHALDVAQDSDCTNKHGAVIVRSGSVLAKAPNKFRNHPTQVSPEHVKTGCTVHAEVAAIKQAGNCKGATIYVARLGKFGPLLSRPCSRCYDAILEAGITEVIHT